MESPLDILSRAAGMVSRNYDIPSPTASAHSVPAHKECHILKLGVATPRTSSSNNSSPSQTKRSNSTSEDTPDLCSLDNDSDVPLDMSIKKPKRKTSSSDDEEEGFSSTGEQPVKRKRPSVISYASHPAISMAGFDVDDHFKKSLGLEFYNSVFSNNATAAKQASSSDDKTPRPASTNGSRRGSQSGEDSTENKTNGTKSLPQDQPAELETTVDDHFVKALGKSTWMRLRQGL